MLDLMRREAQTHKRPWEEPEQPAKKPRWSVHDGLMLAHSISQQISPDIVAAEPGVAASPAVAASVAVAACPVAASVASVAACAILGTTSKPAAFSKPSLHDEGTAATFACVQSLIALSR